MNHLRLARKNREVNPKSWDDLYRNSVVRGIRKGGVPSVNEENAILRKTIAKMIEILVAFTGMTEEQAKEAFAEFYELNSVVEGIKAQVKGEMND